MTTLLEKWDNRRIRSAHFNEHSKERQEKEKGEAMTLLERFDKYANELTDVEVAEVRRALAIAQIVEAHMRGGSLYAASMLKDADELLEGKP